MPPLLQSQSVAVIPDHELIRCIGRGSYGEVWLARNVVGTCRAVKVVHRNSFDDERPYEREYQGIQKFEPVSRSHEGLIDILQIGRNDSEGYFYYVMELADDQFGVPPSGGPAHADRLKAELQTYSPKTLRSEAKRRSRLPVGECIEIGLSLASALEHLHKHGLVHRDIKPSNIIFVQGVPKLADIGLVTSVDASRSYVGTEGFVPPEGPGSPQADIYSLGKVLYEISMGRDRTDFPQLPANLDNLPGAQLLIELNEVVLIACHKDVAERYSTGAALRSDLQALKQGQSLKGKRTRERRLAVFTRFATMLAGITLMIGIAAALINARSVPGSSKTSREADAACELGWFFFNKLTREGVTKAIEHFNRAIQLDTNLVAAYAGLADCYIWNPPFGYVDALPRIGWLADRILQLDKKRAEGYTALGVYNWWAQGKPVLAERAFERAIKLDEHYAPAHHYYGILLTCLGRCDQARHLLEQAVELRPTSVNFRVALGWPYLAGGDFDRAIVEFEKAREFEPETFTAHKWLAHAYQGKGDFQRALTHWEKADMLKYPGSAAVQRDYAEARRATRDSGAAGYWQARLTTALSEKQPILVFIATAYANLGQKEKAVQVLERAAVEAPADVGILRLFLGPVWDEMRSEPGFLQLIGRLGLQ